MTSHALKFGLVRADDREVRTDVPDDDGSAAPSLTLLRSRPPAERLRRLAELWPSFDDEDRAMLESHLHRLREKAAR